MNSELPLLSPDEQPVDSRRLYVLTMAAQGGGAVSGFTGSESFACRIWPGGSAPTLATPTCSWNTAPTGPGNAASNAAAGTFGVTITPTDLLGLLPATYRVEVKINPGLDDVLAFNGMIKVAEAPGSTPLPFAYGTTADMRLYFPAIEDLQTDSDLAGFAVQLGRATSHLIDVIVALYKPGWRGMQVGQPGYASACLGGGYPDSPESIWLRQQLEGGGLVVRDKTREILAKKAIAYVLDAQIDKQGENPFARMAARFHRDSDNLLLTYRAEINADANGYPAIVVHCGCTNLR